MTCQKLAAATASADSEVVALNGAAVSGWRGEAAEREANVRQELVAESEQLRAALHLAAQQAEDLEQLLYMARRSTDSFGII